MKGRIKDFFSRDRKTLYMILSIVLISIFSLTIVYAALSVTLNIQGSAEVVASKWDIHLDNVKVTSGSVSGNAPTITGPTTATFSTTLNMPGDFYELTIDVVNDGSIDAMIDSVTKEPTLSTQQAKYLNYIIEYQNGESINTKQLVSKNSFVRLKVKVEYRKDITASDLPTTSETLNLAFTVNYIQSDSSGSSVTDNGVYNPFIIGNELCIKEECFYVISSDEDSVTMLSKMSITKEVTPKQSSSAPTIKFSSTNYWSSSVSSYPAYIYDSNSTLYEHVENYRIYLESQGVLVEEARLITYEELGSLGCSGNDRSCSSAPDWVYSTTYWSGSAYGTNYLWKVTDYDSFTFTSYNTINGGKIRPVITISKSYF